jgi:hypothetical protein
MSAITRLALPAASDISEVTVAAVDQIGTTTSDQIRHVADQIEAEAHAIGGKLRELAGRFDEQTGIASEKINGFCSHMASARAMISGLKRQIDDLSVAAERRPG